MKTVDELIAGDSVAPKPCHLLYNLPLGLALTISSQPTPATVHIIYSNDLITLKRFFLDTERRCVRLHPENPKYPDIYTQNCTVQGVAVHVIKSLE